MNFRSWPRLIRIGWVLARHGLDDLLYTLPVLRRLAFLRYVTPGYWLHSGRPRGERLRKALEDLGPVFVKLGQILSTRRDLLPPDIAEELALLQDRVPPFPSDDARGLIEAAFDQPVDELFLRFDPDPLASASIAQVHTARLPADPAHGRPEDQEVVVKVVRPGIGDTIRQDVALMYILARAVERYWSEGRRLRPVEVVGEFEKTIYDELDLMREAANASMLRRNFEGSGQLYIPAVYWTHTRASVMVMERIDGIPVNHTEAIRDAGVDLRVLAERGVEIFFTQAFKHNFFHADMHPGNIFVARDGRYLAVDFGIMGSLNPEDQRYLAENFVAFFNRDYRRVAELHVESRWVPPETRIDEFEAAIRTVCEPIFERPLKEISFGHLLLRLFQVARRFHMEVQPQLVLLQKTLLNIEGLGRQLYPDLDLWRTAKPFLEDWMKQQVGPRAFIRNLRHEAPHTLEMLPSLPGLAERALTRLAEPNHGPAIEARLERLEERQHQGQRRQRLTTAGVGLLLAGALLATLGLGDPRRGPAWLEVPLIGWGSAVLGGLLLLRGMFR